MVPNEGKWSYSNKEEEEDKWNGWRECVDESEVNMKEEMRQKWGMGRDEKEGNFGEMCCNWYSKDKWKQTAWLREGDEELLRCWETW